MAHVATAVSHAHGQCENQHVAYAVACTPLGDRHSQSSAALLDAHQGQRNGMYAAGCASSGSTQLGERHSQSSAALLDAHQPQQQHASCRAPGGSAVPLQGTHLYIGNAAADAYQRQQRRSSSKAYGSRARSASLMHESHQGTRSATVHDTQQQQQQQRGGCTVLPAAQQQQRRGTAAAPTAEPQQGGRCDACERHRSRRSGQARSKPGSCESEHSGWSNPSSSNSGPRAPSGSSGGSVGSGSPPLPSLLALTQLLDAQAAQAMAHATCVTAAATAPACPAAAASNRAPGGKIAATVPLGAAYPIGTVAPMLHRVRTCARVPVSVPNVYECV